MMPSVLPILMFTLISLILPSRAARAVHLQKKGELYTAPPFQFSLFQNHFVFLQTHCWLIANLGKSSDLGFYQEMLVESIFCSSRKVNFHQKMTMGSFMLGTVALKLMSEQNNGKIPLLSSLISQSWCWKKLARQTDFRSISITVTERGRLRKVRSLWHCVLPGCHIVCAMCIVVLQQCVWHCALCDPATMHVWHCVLFSCAPTATICNRPNVTTDTSVT